MGIVFRPGRGYYELTKPEKLAPNKQVLILGIEGFAVEGDAARAALGVPSEGEGRTVPLRPGTCAEGRRVFVQSTSYNRKLVSGTDFLYEVPEGGDSPRTGGGSGRSL